MDCKVELKKQVLPVLRRPLYLGLVGRLVGADEEALDEWEQEAVERARLNGCVEPEAFLPEEGEGVYGWRRDAACKPGFSMSL